MSENKEFNELVINLEKNGYVVNVINEDGYYSAKVSGNKIIGGFCEPNNDSNRYINGRFAFDNYDCFDKYSKCPYSLPLPQTQEQFDYILSKLQYLATPNGYEASNSYEIDFIDEYPSNLK